MNDNILISVVIPAYNTDKYLEKAVNSIINQTYKNLEIILVNDGSTDNSAKICKEFAEKDQRVIFLDRKHEGVTPTKKAGVELATGTYTTIIDSDDWMDLTAFEEIVESIANYTELPDVVTYGYIREEANASILKSNPVKPEYYTGDKLLELKKNMLPERMLDDLRMQPAYWSKLIKSDILKKCISKVENSIVLGDDDACVLDCVIQSDSLLALDFSPYHYLQRESSLVHAHKTSAEAMRASFRKLEEDFADFDDQVVKNGILYHEYKMLLLKGCNLLSQNSIYDLLDCKNKQSNKTKVALYGAGLSGMNVVHRLNDEGSKIEIVKILDKNYGSACGTFAIEDPRTIVDVDFDCILITILNKDIIDDVTSYLESLGVPKNKIKSFLVDKEKMKEIVSTI